MKIVLLFAACLLTAVSFSQTIVTSKKFGKLEFVKLDHGLAQVLNAGVDKLDNAPTGDHSRLDDFVISKVTDSIPAKLGTNFGVVYMMKAESMINVDVDIEWIYPKQITNDKNQSFKSVRYTTNRPTNEISASSYSLDEPYEVEVGNWIMNIYIGKKQVYTKTFVMY